MLAASKCTGSQATVQQLLNQMPDWKEKTAPGSHKVFQHIQHCHTAHLGYHVYRCSDSDCGAMHYSYHSCRNRHCPACGNNKTGEWISSRMKELLPCKYYHAVFTLPHQLNCLVLGNRVVMFNLLFNAASYTLLNFAKDQQYLGAQPGIIAVLHTWGQQLSFHPHVHCIISGGGIDKNQRWKAATKAKHKFLFPAKAVTVVYRAYFLKQLQQHIDQGSIAMSEVQQCNWISLRSLLYQTEWITYFKEPMGGVAQVMEYLGRYTHKVAISNHRIKSIDIDNKVTFEYKDYADEGRNKQMILSGEEFLRRFEQHILPPRFCKIRYYGYLGNYKRKQRVNELLKQMGLPLHAPQAGVSSTITLIEKFGIATLQCPYCKKAKLELLYIVDAKGNKKEVLRE